MSDDRIDDSDAEPKTIANLERSDYPTLRADVRGTGALRDLTEEMLIQAARDIPIAMERRRRERSEMRREWIPIIMWLFDQKARHADACRLASIVGMALEMGPPFVTNIAGYDFMKKCWKEYEERSQ